MAPTDRGERRTRLRRNRPVLHEAPVAAAEADCVVLAAIDRPGLPIRVEALAARRLDDDLYEICCVPFFAEDIAFGDTVHAPVAHTGGLTRPTFSEVIEPSGHICLRVWFPRDTDPTDRLAVEADVDSHGGRIERLGEDLLAIDVPEHASVAVSDVLEQWEARGAISYETGHTS
jgi:hypothetical protein